MSDRPVLDGKEVEPQDVEITAEMVEAGEAVFEALSATYPPHLLVQEIYRAMAAVAPE